jgi:hypothetical protein
MFFCGAEDAIVDVIVEQERPWEEQERLLEEQAIRARAYLK